MAKTATRTFTISPLSPIGLVIGAIIQTCYGWHYPKDALDMMWMGVHIFIAPAVLVICFFLCMILVPLIFGMFLMLIGLLFNGGQEASRRYRISRRRF